MLPARRTTKSQRTRTAILQAALALFQEKGFAGTTMRHIAAKAEVAAGGAYYHFKSKDEIVLAFYAGTLEATEERARLINSETKEFRSRLRDIILFKITQLNEYRCVLGQLASHAIVPGSPLSPFSEETHDIRQRAIAMFREMVKDSDLVIAAKLRPQFPAICWIYQLGILLYWLHDESQDQAQTQTLLDTSLDLLVLLSSLSSLPPAGPVNSLLHHLLECFPIRSTAGR